MEQYSKNAGRRGVIATTLALFATLLPASEQDSAAGVRVFVGSGLVEYPEARPTVQSGRLLVPLRETAERMGWTVARGLGRYATVSQGGTTIVLPWDGRRATRNGIPIATRFYPQIGKGWPLVPLEFFSVGLKAVVVRDPRRATVQILPRGGSVPAKTATRPRP